MFEHVCAWLLRLYPAEFQRAYGPDALQLIEDRARDERGLFRRARLLIDLTTDLLVISLRGSPGTIGAAVRVGRAPVFDVISGSGPRPEPLAAGMALAILLFASFTLLLPAKGAIQSQRHFGRTVGGRQQASAAGLETPHALVAAIAVNLAERYVDRAIGQQLANALLAHDQKGDYGQLDAGPALAARLNRDIQTVSRGVGLPPGVFVADVVYSVRTLPGGPPPPITPEARERNRAALVQRNCLFEQIELPSLRSARRGRDTLAPSAGPLMLAAIPIAAPRSG